MTAMVGPAVALGYDSGLYQDSVFDPSLPLLEDLQDMTAGRLNGDAVSYEHHMVGVELSAINLSSAVESSRMRGPSVSVTDGNSAALDALSSFRGRTNSHLGGNQSTARSGLEGSAGGSSRSPGTTNSVILTPASTLLEYNASISGSNHPGEEDSDDNLSPTSTNQTDSDYVHVSHSHLDLAHGRQLSQMSNNRPPHSSSRASGVSDAHHPSRASSIAPSTASFSGAAQWGSLGSSSSGFMDHSQHPQGTHSEFFGISASQVSDDAVFVPSTQQCTDDLLSNIHSFDYNMFNASLPFRPTYEHHMFNPQYSSAQTQHHYSTGFAPQQAQYYSQHHGGTSGPPDSNYGLQWNVPSTESLLVPQPSSQPTAPRNIEQARLTPSPMQGMPNNNNKPFPSATSARTSPYPRPTAPRTQAGPVTQPKRQAKPPIDLIPQGPANASAAARRLLIAGSTVLPSNDPQTSQNEKRRHGGRQKNTHLEAEARIKSSKMRKKGSCWRCALQRDPCDEESPCKRCRTKAEKGHVFFFPCDRSKLPDFVHDFLPLQASMTVMHQKQTIEDTVREQVREWDLETPIDLYLSSGYGPPFRIQAHEFKPKTDELLGQFQYLQDPTTGRTHRYKKYSPPFGLLKLDSSDSTHFENYLEELLSTEYLWDLGWTCFEEETQVDEDAFQARLLDLICKLYTTTHDFDLKQLLKEIIRMTIITYIMGHTLTILEDTLPSVLKSVKHSPRGQRLPHTSPRLANRQLKFFFAVLRTNIYEKILKWQQQTWHTSVKKEPTWLPSFCAMLGFAMVLEEVQRTIQIQADAKAVKNEMPFDHAMSEASNACERIDERFTFLVGLFQCKYRDKKWGDNGSFGPQTPEFKDQPTKDFLRELRQLTEEKQAHLQSRKDVQFAPDNQCRYTSRLVARFLLPFLSLPRN